MARQIFIVDARIVDQNGTFNHISGYPKVFDSNSYQGDIFSTVFDWRYQTTTWGMPPMAIMPVGLRVMS